MKRDWRLLAGIIGILAAAIVIGYDVVETMTYQHHWSINDQAYFEKRFETKMPKNCYDCWPPMRTSFLEAGLATFLASLLTLIYAWWKPKI
ncbi:hypothetical protein [Sphingorhabdus sp.]|uniref:hypothetical protein n=1 Tax=Sphingorhabdus sp. TaxID=1902408 RepID=UPI0032B84351